MSLSRNQTFLLAFPRSTVSRSRSLLNYVSFTPFRFFALAAAPSERRLQRLGLETCFLVCLEAHQPPDSRCLKPISATMHQVRAPVPLGFSMRSRLPCNELLLAACRSFWTLASLGTNIRAVSRFTTQNGPRWMVEMGNRGVIFRENFQRSNLGCFCRIA